MATASCHMKCVSRIAVLGLFMSKMQWHRVEQRASRGESDCEEARSFLLSWALFTYAPPPPQLTPFCSSVSLICNTQLHSCCSHRTVVCGGQTERRGHRVTVRQAHITSHTHMLTNTCSVSTMNRERRGVLRLIPQPQRTTRQSKTLRLYMTESRRGEMTVYGVCWST